MGFAALSVVIRHLRDALQLVDIRVLDHLIVAGDQVSRPSSAR
jgi:DNA repair protein RadC